MLFQNGVVISGNQLASCSSRSVQKLVEALVEALVDALVEALEVFSFFEVLVVFLVETLLANDSIFSGLGTTNSFVDPSVIERARG